MGVIEELNDERLYIQETMVNLEEQGYTEELNNFIRFMSNMKTCTVWNKIAIESLRKTTNDM